MADAGGVRRLEAILAADVAGYSRLMQDDDEATVATLEAYRSIFREKIEAHRGRIVDMAGDSILAVFETATGVVRAAFEIQSELAQRNEALPEPRRMRFRIGVNLGEVIEKPDGTVYGDGVNIAARLESIGEPGGVTVSGTVFDQVKNRLQLGFDFIGEQEVKNIAELVRAYRVVAEGQGAGSSQQRKVPRRARPPFLGAIAAAALIAGFSIWWGARTLQRTPAQPVTSVPSVAVLAFDNLSGDLAQEYFADGITEEIIASLSRFQNLRVSARNSTFQYKRRAVDPRTIGRELGVRYLVEGSVRRSPDSIRITAQAIETNSGSHVWAENYQRPITPSNILDIQQEIASRIAAAIGGDVGVLVTKEFQDSRGKPPADLSAYECNLRSLGYIRTESLEDHKIVRDCLERTVENYPEYADAWSGLAVAYLDEDRFGYNPRPGSLDRALKAAERAAQLAPQRQIVYDSLLLVHFFRGEREAFLAAVDRGVALNPNNSVVLADAGLQLAYAGQWERGLGLLNKAIAMEPDPPGWYHFGAFFDHYRKGEYEAALGEAQKANMPDYVWSQALYAAAYGQLGRADEAKPYVKKIREMKPDFETTAREKRRKWFRFQEPLLDQFMDGLRKAGLNIPEKKL